ncbi:MAG: hypothetical protein WEC36_10890 [Phycisphaeraceae bacterium]
MRFFRLLLVVTAITVCGGVFGAAVGGLVGYAVPSSLKVMFGVEKDKLEPDAVALGQREAAPGSVASSQQSHTQFGVGLDTSTHMAPAGAALGGAWGLVSGAVAGLFLGALDQIIILIRAGWAARSARASTALAPREPPEGSIAA